MPFIDDIFDRILEKLWVGATETDREAGYLARWDNLWFLVGVSQLLIVRLKSHHY